MRAAYGLSLERTVNSAVTSEAEFCNQAFRQAISGERRSACEYFPASCSGCHWTPSRNGCPGCSTASMMPSKHDRRPSGRGDIADGLMMKAVDFSERDSISAPAGTRLRPLPCGPDALR